MNISNICNYYLSYELNKKIYTPIVSFRANIFLTALYSWKFTTYNTYLNHPYYYIFFLSCSYVLPKHMLLQIAEVLPKEMQGVLACCNPIPPLVKTELLTIHTIIRAAREQKLLPVSSCSAIKGRRKDERGLDLPH